MHIILGTVTIIKCDHRPNVCFMKDDISRILQSCVLWSSSSSSLFPLKCLKGVDLKADSFLTLPLDVHR